MSFHERLGPDARIQEQAHHIARELNESPRIGLQHVREIGAMMRTEPMRAAELLQDIEFYQSREPCRGPRVTESIMPGRGGYPGQYNFGVSGTIQTYDQFRHRQVITPINEFVGSLPETTFQQGYFVQPGYGPPRVGIQVHKRGLDLRLKF